MDWSLFDWVGVDYYRHGEPEAQYVKGLDRYKEEGKPVAVMEFGSCAFEGAGALGDAGFTLLQGATPDGVGIFKDGVVPVRNETEQADYIETQVRLFAEADIDASFVFEFSFPCMPLGVGARDMDMMSFPIVKTFSPTDPRSTQMPPWVPKEAFHRLAAVYKRLAEQADGSPQDDAEGALTSG